MLSTSNVSGDEVNDMFDMDIEMLDLNVNDDTGELSGPTGSSVGVKGHWQLSHERLPDNPDLIATGLGSKLARMVVRDDLFKFATDVVGDSSSLTSTRCGLTQDNSLHQSTSSWGDLGLSRSVLKAISQILCFPNPTVIQREVIPLAISGKDILATASTGSGKSAAFLVPLIERVIVGASVSTRRKNIDSGKITGGRASTRAIILLPTRELAVQCWSMLKALATFVPVTSALVVGGFDSRDQKVDLMKQPDIIVATPGRLLDHILNSQGVHLENVDMVVLDEADRLLELGFKESITEILKAVPKKSLAVWKGKKSVSRGQCQTLLFSATLGADVKDLASMVLCDAVTARITDPSHVVASLTQEFVRIGREDVREASFFSLLESAVHTPEASRSSGRVVVFFREKKEAHRLATIAQLFGLGVAQLNGNMNQAERLQGMADFQSGVKRYLFATDLASRGLDMPNVETVINYNLPPALDAETRYIHRVGRTARMGKTGRSITLYTAEEYSIVKRIVKKSVDRERRGKIFDRKISVELSEIWHARISSVRKILSEIQKEEMAEAEMYISAKKITQLEKLSRQKREIVKERPKMWLKTRKDSSKLRAHRK